MGVRGERMWEGVESFPEIKLEIILRICKDQIRKNKFS